MSDLQESLRRAATAVETATSALGAVVTAGDQRHMWAAFHRAETLAHTALRAALPQLDHSYRAELEEQIEDEQRHVALFASWLCEPTAPASSPPPPRQRPAVAWFGMLLVNEMCGFCQFQMLAALLADAPAKRRRVIEVADDEGVHIHRLVRWLAAMPTDASSREVGKIALAFRRNLPRRMSQFLPRDEHAALRDAMCRIIGELVGTLET